MDENIDISEKDAMSENTAIFEEMPIKKALAKLSIPTIISQLITMVYNLSDTFFYRKK